MNDYDYIHIESWMGSRLGLRGNLLLCFALIHGYTRFGNGLFKGTLKYLADSLFCSEPTVIACLDKLIELELIRKQKITIKGHERCGYSVCVTFQDGELACIDDTKDSLVGHTKDSLVGHTKDSLVYNNKEYNNKENKKRDNNKSLSPKNKRFVKPTIKQIEEYIKEKDMHFEAERFFDYYESKGWMVGKSPMKDWKAACRTWESQRKHEFKEEPTEESTQLDLWQRQQEWFKRNVPNIAHLITKEMYGKMRIICIVQMDFQQALLNMNEGFEGDFLEAFREEVKRCAGG